VFYYENIEGGHGGAADNKQQAYMKTLEFAFLEKTLVRRATPRGVAAPRPTLRDLRLLRPDFKILTPVLGALVLGLLVVGERRR